VSPIEPPLTHPTAESPAMNILQVNSSARVFENDQGSHSTRLANELSARLLADHAGATLTVRDLARQPHPVLDESALGALFTPAEARTPEQAARVALDDALIAEIQAADVVVLGVPMYNFGVTAQLKNWIDAIARARVTFQYTEKGPVGLLTGKTVYAVLSRGGVHRGTERDSQVPYLKSVLGFLGMTDVHFIYAEGLAMGPDAEAQALANARSEIEQLFQGEAALAR
jgi:FMN-dependent NADH-azoreductase